MSYGGRCPGVNVRGADVLGWEMSYGGDVRVVNVRGEDALGGKCPGANVRGANVLIPKCSNLHPHSCKMTSMCYTRAEPIIARLFLEQQRAMDVSVVEKCRRSPSQYITSCSSSSCSSSYSSSSESSSSDSEDYQEPIKKGKVRN
jgi:hypothetical protein